MSARSLNKVMLIGNLTRDPELRYTPQGTPVCTMGVATNRSWVDSNNQHQEETEYHRVIAWSKLAELCHQLLFKGRKVYLEGRLQTRRWTTQAGEERQTTEVVIDEMIVLDNRRREEGEEDMTLESNTSAKYQAMPDDVAKAVADDAPVSTPAPAPVPIQPAAKSTSKKDKEEVSADDIQL